MGAVYTIRQVAQQTGLSIDTLRYYERISLIEPVKRAANGHRQYRQEDLDWINLIIRLRETSMPLAQISYFAQLRHQGPQTTTERRLILEDHQHLLAQQMHQLVQHMEALTEEIVCYKEREEILVASSPAISFSATTTEEEEIR
ncbi:MAG: MerR family transcriptional regulator [Ktedonobacteraceae bacterium]|nr:MerR family transcriptional regulator [Ktedonobacteraceae bacterium]